MERNMFDNLAPAVLCSNIAVEPLDSVIRVVLVDGQPIMRSGIKAALENSGQFAVAVEPDIMRAPELIRELRPDVVLADPGDDGDCVRLLVESVREVKGKLVVLADGPDWTRFLEAIRCGADGFLVKRLSEAELQHAVQAVAHGFLVICPDISPSLSRHFSAFPSFGESSRTIRSLLSDREIAVLLKVGAGKTNREIATDLNIAETTIKSHVSKILAKLGLSSRVEAALALRQIDVASLEAARPSRVAGPA
jgi:DNA-binding NarL/FixJ family response regulator